MYSALIEEGAPESLPELLDTRRLMDELGVKRSTAEAIMRAIPVQAVPRVRKLYVRRSDVLRFLDENLVERGRPR
jgi:DNA-binding transcriptional MocR family regulator